MLRRAARLRKPKIGSSGAMNVTNESTRGANMSNYEKLAAINVNDKIEKKNGLSYLSWAFAVDTLMRTDPEANWTYLEPLQFGDTLMVRCAVTAFGKTMVCQLPVMDYKNKAIQQPDAFQVNTAMQRCLVKAIALHGLGLYIYAGEDLPEGAEKPEAEPKAERQPEAKKVSPVRPNSAGEDFWNNAEGDEKAYLQSCLNSIIDFRSASDAEGAAKFFYGMNDIDEQGAVWSQLDSKTRNEIKKYKPQPEIKEAA